MTYAENSSHAHYVTLRRGRRTALLLGPYRTHDEAAANVDRARAEAVRIDSWAGFDAVGTARITLRPGADAPEGVLNARLGIGLVPGRADD